MATQSLDFSDLGARQVSNASPASPLDFSDLGGRRVDTPAASASQMRDANMPTVSQYNPTVWDRLRDAFPILDRIQTGAHLPGYQAQTNAEALAKPLPGMSEERAIAPEQAMMPSERQAHPVATGAGEFAGGLTTPSNMLLMGTSGMLGKIPGTAGAVLPRVASGIFSAQMLRGAYEEWPGFRAAVDRKDWSEVERLATHMVLGATMAGLGIKHAATGEPVQATEGPVKSSIYEGYRKMGQAFARAKQSSASLNNITESATGLYNSIRNDLITHQQALRNDGARTIQDAIAADKAALMNTNRGSISTAGAVAEVSKALEETGYNRDMTAADRAQIRKIVNQPELTLEEAKTLRTTIGNAMSRAKDPRWKAALTAAYAQLGEGMNARITELQGTSRPYEHYNNQFKASFELEDGIAGKMMESLQGQDRHAAMPRIKDFGSANLDEIKEQMQKLGLDQQSKSLDNAQRHAKALTNAYDVVNGKYMSGIYRMFMQNPKEAWPGLVVMMAGHGMGMPFPVPQITGAIVGAAHIGMRGKASAARVGQELKTTLPPEYFRTRTEAEVPESFTYRDPDEGWTGTSSPPSGPASAQESKAAAVKGALARRKAGRRGVSE